ncbi:MAG: hypothetical protein LRS49_03840 [Desulfurococcales archaeon]|nr:hypothetical protein [Desulfurococcales archaeon]
MARAVTRARPGWPAAPASPGFGGSSLMPPASRGSESPAEKLIIPYLDSRLSKRLLGSNLWLARLKRRAEAREELGRLGFDDILIRVVDVWRGRGKPVYAVLSNGRRELRVLAYDNSVGVALVERGRGESGRTALDAARGMAGQGTVYILREVPR